MLPHEFAPNRVNIECNPTSSTPRTAQRQTLTSFLFLLLLSLLLRLLLLLLRFDDIPEDLRPAFLLLLSWSHSVCQVVKIFVIPCGVQEVEFS